jgi:elongation factor G
VSGPHAGLTAFAESPSRGTRVLWSLKQNNKQAKYMKDILNLDMRPLDRIRNIGIAAHIDAGKTTLTERLLYYAGAIHKAGNVDDGNTTTDFDPIEQRKGITIFAAAVSCTWTQEASQNLAKLFESRPHRLNIIDTPGHVDFTAEVERSLRVLDGMVAVFCAVGGVQPQSETVWRQANRYHVPRLAFINKMDRVGANFNRVLQELLDRLGANAAPVLLPWGSENQLLGQLDVVDGCAYTFSKTESVSIVPIPDDLREAVESARAELITRIADVDDEVAALYLANQNVPSATLKAAIRRATIANQFVPVVAGSAHQHVGIQPLLDAIVDYLPSPMDTESITAHIDGTECSIDIENSAPCAALVFKVVHDEQGRRTVFLRNYTGTLKKGDRVLNVRTGRQERVGRLMRLFADRREDVIEAYPGDIVAAIGLAAFSTGDTACDPARSLQLERPVFPEPVVSMALEPRLNRDRDRLAIALATLSDEDPTFRTFTHPETGQSIIAGMGELHLEVLLERLERDHGVQVNAGQPAIAYRETISASAEADHLLRKQNGGNGMYARVNVAVRPNEPGQGFSIDNLVSGGNIPQQFLKAVRNGIQEGLQEGVLAGYPVVDVHVDILDGAAHEKDSNDVAFRLAAASAVREALQKAKPQLLEPVMRVEVETPNEEQGDLLGDLTRRRGNILAVEPGRNTVVLNAQVPLAELWGYANAIRSLSRGRASYSMTPSHFERVPDGFVTKIVNASRK